MDMKIYNKSGLTMSVYLKASESFLHSCGLFLEKKYSMNYARFSYFSFLF